SVRIKIVIMAPPLLQFLLYLYATGFLPEMQTHFRTYIANTGHRKSRLLHLLSTSYLIDAIL
ncbi:MAG: hypothetical protein IKU09_09720, partial [Firmicutes bacterium]|nr:hypothetical protein [Bacillota bacterium]